MDYHVEMLSSSVSVSHSNLFAAVFPLRTEVYHHKITRFLSHSACSTWILTRIVFFEIFGRCLKFGFLPFSTLSIVLTRDFVSSQLLELRLLRTTFNSRCTIPNSIRISTQVRRPTPPMSRRNSSNSREELLKPHHLPMNQAFRPKHLNQNLCRATHFIMVSQIIRKFPRALAWSTSARTQSLHKILHWGLPSCALRSPIWCHAFISQPTGHWQWLGIESQAEVRWESRWTLHATKISGPLSLLWHVSFLADSRRSLGCSLELRS